MVKPLFNLHLTLFEIVVSSKLGSQFVKQLFLQSFRNFSTETFSDTAIRLA